MQINSTFVEMLSILAEEKAEFLVVGGYAVAMHAEPRFTKDLDIWYKPTKANAAKVWRALVRFGAPMEGVSAADLADPKVFFQIGVAPVRIDMIAAVQPLDFNAAKARAVNATFENANMPILSFDDLLASKRFADRPQDREDVKALLSAEQRRITNRADK